MKSFSFEPSPMVCSENITVTVDGDRIDSVRFLGGCPGNLIGISRLVKGKTIGETIDLLKGIRCGGKPTSCPDQLAQGLRKYLAENQKKDLKNKK